MSSMSTTCLRDVRMRIARDIFGFLLSMKVEELGYLCFKNMFNEFYICLSVFFVLMLFELIVVL